MPSSIIITLVLLGMIAPMWAGFAWVGGLLVAGAFIVFVLWTLWPQVLGGLVAVAAVWWVLPRVQRMVPPTDAEMAAWLVGLGALHVVLFALYVVGRNKGGTL